MNLLSIIQNLSIAVTSQGISMVISLVTMLLVPKVLGVEEFGYWQLFVLYQNYVGFFHLGLNDGVYLIKGGQLRGEIDKRSINSQFWVGLSYQMVFAVVILLAAFAQANDQQRTFILIMVALSLLINNSNLYLGFVFQAMNETKLFSFSIIVERISFILPLVVLLVVREPSFEAYVISYVSAKACSLLFCCWKARDIFTSGLLTFVQACHETLFSIRVGIKLMLANIVGMLVLGSAQFAIDACWTIEVFSKVALALTMSSFILTFASQVSMVLYPALRRVGRQSQSRAFSELRDALAITLPILYLLYQPINELIIRWLPNYADSLPYFAMLLPLCIFDGRMSMAGLTFIKVLRKEQALLAINLATLAICLAGVAFGAFFLRSVVATILSVLVSIVSRCYIVEAYVGKIMHVKMSSAAIAPVFLTLLFLVVTYYLPNWFGWLLTALALLVYLAIFRTNLVSMIQTLKSVVLTNS